MHGRSRDEIFSQLFADYPSIGQVNYLARKHNVHVIWAVTEDKFRLYSELAKMVEGSSAGVISSDSSNVVELVRKQYEVITTTIRVTANSSANCPTEIKSKCKGRGKSYVQGGPTGFTPEIDLLSDF